MICPEMEVSVPVAGSRDCQEQLNCGSRRDAAVALRGSICTKGKGTLARPRGLRSEEKLPLFLLCGLLRGLLCSLLRLPCCLFSLSICDGSLRRNIIAICSLYRVIEKNSQEKNAHQVEHLGDAIARIVSATTMRSSRLSLPKLALLVLHAARDPHEYWRFASSAFYLRSERERPMSFFVEATVRNF